MPLSTADRARRFHALHRGPDVLRLCNVWDAGSARITAAQGAAALATSSASVAWSQGYPDGDALPVERLLETVEHITASSGDLPLTVDAESGYSDDPAQVARLAGELVARGAVGLNLEDGTGSPDLLAAKIAAIRAAADAAGIDRFYINARTDVWLHELAPKGERVAEALRRAKRYAAAGASGLFVPGVTDAQEIEAVVGGTPLPINVMAFPGVPDVPTLARLGVRRLSAGAMPGKIVAGVIAQLARGFHSTGTLDAAGASAMTWVELNALMRSPSSTD